VLPFFSKDEFEYHGTTRTLVTKMGETPGIFTTGSLGMVWDQTGPESGLVYQQP
jgi:hypothetical protein